MNFSDYYKNKQVLVTGGCGFIGSHIAEQLVLLGAHVTILDNLSTGFRHNMASIVEQINFIEGDITNFETCLKATHNIDTIFHLAAFISVPQSMHEPHTCHTVNVLGTLNLLEAAKQNGCKNFIFSSSAAVYGPQENILTESDTCLPASPYGSSKYICEFLCKDYTATGSLNCIALRYFNVHGPRQNPRGSYAAAVAQFTDKLTKNESITIFGDGSQTRDFIHISKVVEANLIAAFFAQKHRGKVFNIATGKSISILRILEQLRAEHPQYTGDINFSAPRPGDVMHSRASTKKWLHVCAEYDGNGGGVIPLLSSFDDSFLVDCQQ